MYAWLKCSANWHNIASVVLIYHIHTVWSVTLEVILYLTCLSTFNYLCWAIVKWSAFREIGSRVMLFRISIVPGLALNDLFDIYDPENDLKHQILRWHPITMVFGQIVENYRLWMVSCCNSLLPFWKSYFFKQLWKDFEKDFERKRLWKVLILPLLMKIQNDLIEFNHTVQELSTMNSFTLQLLAVPGRHLGNHIFC